MAKYCSECKATCGDNAKFCGKCGSKINETMIKTLDDYMADKSAERRSLFGKKSLSKKLKQTPKKKTVSIQVGIMKLDGGDGNHSLKKKRGAWATISISPEASWEGVLQLAVEKHGSPKTM